MTVSFHQLDRETRAKMSLVSKDEETLSSNKYLWESGESHLGKHILNMMKKYEDEIHQIEVVTCTTETNGSVRLRTIRMAEALKNRGLKKGDVVLLAAVNHNDVCIPYFASLCIGTIPMGITTEMKHLEIKHLVSFGRPKIVFCDPVIAASIRKVLPELKLEAEIVVFGNEAMEGYTPFSEFIKETGTEENFKCDEFDGATTPAVLACSSGTTGLPKLVTMSHQYLFYSAYWFSTSAFDIKRKGSSWLTFSPMYWVSASITILSTCLLGYCRIQSIRPFSPEIFDKASKLYKPTIFIVSQLSACAIVRYSKTHNVDFSHIKIVIQGGSCITEDIIEEFKTIVPSSRITAAYGCTECLTITQSELAKMGTCGKAFPFIKWKVVDLDTKKELGPHQPGEMVVKSPYVFMGYYNNPEATADAFDENGWYKTGDLLYYDDEGYFYVVDRIKSLMKFRHYQVSSFELENIISTIEGVEFVGVVGLPHYEDGEHPMAFIQLKSDAKVSEQQIKDFVKENLSDCKQLRGGVHFVNELHFTYSGKLCRKTLKTMALEKSNVNSK